MNKLLSPPDEALLLKRFREIEKWCDRREMDHRFVSFFSSADTSINDDQQRRMGYVKRTKAPRMYDTDARWIEKCETVIDLLKGKAAA
jgi:hypothetical protein